MAIPKLLPYLERQRLLIRGAFKKRKDGKFIVDYKGHSVIFNLSKPYIAGYSVWEIFKMECYKSLNVKNVVVVDVGSGIADSSIYFALNGARHVYGYDTDSARCRLALQNIADNNLLGKITIFNKEYDGRRGEAIKIDCDGCEYGLIAQMSKFKKILVEYHNGAEPISTYLRKRGYSITITKGHLGILHNTKNQGLLYAKAPIF